MKRGLKWSDGEDDETSSSDESSAPNTNSDNDSKSKNSSKLKASLQVDSSKKKRKGIDFEALSRHGYRGGLSVLKVPPPKEPEKQDWSWCLGKEQKSKEAEEESFRERQKTRDTLADGEQLLHVQSRREKEKEKERNNLSFQQKEKRKRDLGQASRGKNYVEEEKRLLRDNGVYSGFDS